MYEMKDKELHFFFQISSIAMKYESTFNQKGEDNLILECLEIDNYSILFAPFIFL